MYRHVPTERDKYAWLVQTRRRPDPEGGLTRQTQFLDHVLSMGITITRRPSTISPSTSSSCSGWASLVSSVKTRHISWSSLSGKASEQGVCVQKVAGAASLDRWDHGAPMGQRGPLVEGIMCLFTLPSQDQPLEHKWTLLSSMTTTSPSCLSMRCRSLRMRTRGQALSHLSRHDLLKTRSVQDTNDLSRHTTLVSVSHSMSTSPVIEFVAPARADTLQRVLQQSNTWYLHLLSRTQRVLQ